MRIPTMRVAAVVLLTVSVVSCTSSSDTPTDASTSAIEELQIKLSDSQRIVLEQQAELDQQQSEIETQAAIQEKLAEGLAEAGRQVQEAKALTEESIESLTNLICASTESELPADVPEALVAWQIETQSANGEIPADIEATIIEAAGRDGSWVFIAEFDTRLEPALFSTDSDGRFKTLWGGLALSDNDMWNYMAETFPDDDTSMTACIDLGYFAETNA